MGQVHVLQVAAGLSTQGGGPSVAIVESARALQSDSVTVRVLSPDLVGTATDPVPGRVNNSDLPPGAGEIDIVLCRTRPPRRLAFSPALATALRREVKAADVVHIHALYLFPQLAAFLHAEASRVPFIVAPCGGLSPYYRTRGRVRKRVTDLLWQRRMLNRAAFIHYKTQEEADEASDLGIGAPAYIAPNGMDLSPYRDLPPPDAFRQRHLGGREGPVVMSIGRIAPQKGVDILVEAFGQVVRHHSDALLAVVGPDDKDLVSSLTEMAVRGGFSDNVFFPGMLHGDEKLAALSAASVWALPSRMENFGNAVVEALAAGRPAVVSTAVALAGDLQHAGAAVVTKASADEFAQALTTLLDDSSAREELSRRGRDFARRYDWAMVAPEHLAMYERAVAGSG